MDILMCRGGPKTLHVSAGERQKACTSRTDSHWDWNPGAQSGNNSETRERQVDLHLGPKGEVSRQVKMDFCLLGRVTCSLCWGHELTHQCLTAGLCL